MLLSPMVSKHLCGNYTHMLYHLVLLANYQMDFIGCVENSHTSKKCLQQLVLGIMESEERHHFLYAATMPSTTLENKLMCRWVLGGV